jgi:hypothetical protein
MMVAMDQRLHPDAEVSRILLCYNSLLRIHNPERRKDLIVQWFLPISGCPLMIIDPRSSSTDLSIMNYVGIQASKGK